MPEVFKVEVGGEDLMGPGEVIAAVDFAGVLNGRARHQGHRRVDPAAGPVKSRIHVSIIAAGRPSLLKTCTPGGREMEKLTINPMQPERLASAPRCLARTRSGTECQSPAVKGRKRCRMHEGTNPGAPEGNSHARKLDGRSAKAMAAARYLRGIARLVTDDLA